MTTLTNSKTLKSSAWLGIAFGVFLTFGETLRNWGAWDDWADYSFDYLFAVLLILFGYLCLKHFAAARIALAICWAITMTLFTYSFVWHIQHLNEPNYGLIPHVQLTILIGALDAVAAIGLVCCLSSVSLRPGR